MSPDESGLERSRPEKHSGFGANHAPSSGLVRRESALLVPLERSGLTTPFANQAVAGAGLLTIVLLSGIGVLCYSGVCRALTLEISVWVMLAIFAAAAASTQDCRWAFIC